MSAGWRWWRSRSCFVHLPLDRLHASGLLDDVVDELGRLFIPHLSLADPGLGEQAQQVGVDVVGIPADVGDMFKSTGGPYVRFGELGALFLVLILLVFLSFAAQK